MSIVLTIAGTDPSGAAGIQADLQVIRDFGHHGVSVVTAVLAQNTAGVQRSEAVSIELLAAQLDSVFSDFEVSAVKVGLVPTDEAARLIARRIEGLPVVWDPVMRSGDELTQLFGGTAKALLTATRDVTVLTPNLRELEQFAEVDLDGRDAAISAARKLNRPILLKVGHFSHGSTVADIWIVGDSALELAPLPAIAVDVRGTGCQLSSAIACGLADGLPALDAIERARAYLNRLLHQATRPGRGRPIIVRDV